jgi:hypothetical protein
MAEKMEGWNNKCQRYVAFLDIMGFKDRLQREGHEKVGEMLESFQPTIEMINKMAKDRLRVRKKDINNKAKEDAISITRPISFSDSIILVTSDDSYESALDIIFYVELIFFEALSEGVPIKGAIAYGEQTADFDKSLHFGRPLIDAYELQNELLIYGCVLHHTMEKRLIKLEALEALEDEDLLKWSVPMKSGNINHYLVDWVSFIGINDETVDILSDLYINVSGAPRLYVDNTINCANMIIKRKAELKKKNTLTKHPVIKRKKD